MEPQTATTAPPGANAYPGEAWANAAQLSTIEARVDYLAALAMTVTIPDLRLARVQALKAQIDAGTYDLQPQQVAAALFDYMRARTD
jgi:anti-sigma28 factor (negative regulator of flagellin synthesis)